MIRLRKRKNAKELPHAVRQSRLKRKTARLQGLLLPVAIIILALFVVGAIVSAVNMGKDLSSPFEKRTIVAPLAKTNPTTQLTKSLKDYGLSISGGVAASDSSLVVTLSNGTQVWFDQFKDIVTQVKSLQVIHHRLTIEGKTAKKIDLRFEQPVVVY